MEAVLPVVLCLAVREVASCEILAPKSLKCPNIINMLDAKVISSAIEWLFPTLEKTSSEYLFVPNTATLLWLAVKPVLSVELLPFYISRYDISL